MMWSLGQPRTRPLSQGSTTPSPRPLRTCTTGSPRCRHSMGKHHSDQDLRLEPASYEPSFGKATRVKAKETAFWNKKSSLMEELFSAGFAGRSGPTNGEVAGKAQQLGPSQASARNAFGDSRATVVRSIQASPAEGNRKMVI